ncbi:MAG: hypothetical protein BroJett040_22930 [Oligoflexia bacterium]|nr:MAG: hypothetical protein BroJett040_22930 [Oligoflexia bacterium]
MKKITFALILFSMTAFGAIQISPTLELQNIKTSSLEKQILAPEKKGTVMVFLSARCPCSESHEGLLKKMSEEYADFQFIGIHANQDEDPKIVQAHFQKSEIPFPVLHDPKAKLADQLKAFKTPHAFILSSKGEVLFSGGVTDSHVGDEAQENYLKAAMNDIRQGKSVQKPLVRSLGCVISRETKEEKENVWKN